MKIALNSIKKIMKSTIKRQISLDACYLMKIKVEEFIKEKSKEAEELLKEANRIRKIQGLRVIVRINEEYLNEVFGYFL